MTARVHYREFWGEAKRAALRLTLDGTAEEFATGYAALKPETGNRFAMRPSSRGIGFGSWLPLAELSCTADWSGLLEMRRGQLLGMDRAELEVRMRRYADPGVTLAMLRAERMGPVEDAADFDADKARRTFLDTGGLARGSIRRIQLLPFDIRWCFHTEQRPFWNRARPEVAAQQAAGAAFLVTRTRPRRPLEGYPVFMSCALPGYHLLDPNSHPFPDALHPVAAGALAPAAGEARPNLSPSALAWTAALGLPPDAETSRLVWHHVLAVTYSPAYLGENAAGLRQGWPRIPLPGNAALLRASAALGARLTALLDADTPVEGVTTGALPPALAGIGVPETRAGAAKDWELAGWGIRTDKGVTMPGRGVVTERPYASAEAATGAESALLGATTRDIGMNGASFWRNIPEQVWDTHVGGYQVLKKWLSYRDRSIVKRALNPGEVEHVQATARRLAAIRLMGPALDASFRDCAAAHVPLPGAA